MSYVTKFRVGIREMKFMRWIALGMTSKMVQGPLKGPILSEKLLRMRGKRPKKFLHRGHKMS